MYDHVSKINKSIASQKLEKNNFLVNQKINNVIFMSLPHPTECFFVISVTVLQA